MYIRLIARVARMMRTLSATWMMSRIY